MSEYIELLQQAISIIKMRYDDKMNEMHETNGYGIKAMFADKYSIAYTSCIDDISLGEENPTVNASVYHNGVLENIDFTYAEFLELYRAVKVLYKDIEKKYQKYLAEFTQNPSEERLREIIENNIF